MLTAANLVAFVSVTDPDQAQGFYEKTLGLTLIERNESALVFETRGTELRVTMVEGFEPADHTVIGFDVADASHTMRELRERGVEPEDFGGLEQDELGIWQAPDGTLVAWFKDPDGNLISIAQS